MSHAPRFHRLAVNDLRRESADAVSMTFKIPSELADDYSFAPGQYLTLRTTMDGEEVRRSYSICSGPDDGELRIAVKKVDGGAFSSWAADELKSGDELNVMTPTGRFGGLLPGVARAASVDGSLAMTITSFPLPRRRPPPIPYRCTHPHRSG